MKLINTRIPPLFILLVLVFFCQDGATAQEIDHQESCIGHVKCMHERNHPAYQQLFREVNKPRILRLAKEAGVDPQKILRPGQEGFMGKELGPIYEKLYKKGKCYCKSGYCRPTRIRHVRKGSRVDKFIGNDPERKKAFTRYEVLVNDTWYPVPENALHNENSLSKELMQKLTDSLANASGKPNGHVCAYNVPEKPWPFDQDIECVVIVTIG